MAGNGGFISPVMNELANRVIHPDRLEHANPALEANAQQINEMLRRVIEAV